MKVKVIKSFGNDFGCFNQGKELEVKDEIALPFVRLGWLEPIETEKPDEPVAVVEPLPIKKKRATRTPSKSVEQE